MIARVDPLEDASWDAHISNCTGVSFFHGQAWQRVMQEAYRFIPGSFVATHADHMTAVLPMMEVRSPLTGNRGISLPFTDECATAGDDTEAPSLFNAAVEYGTQRRWRYLEFRSSHRAPKEAIPSLSFFGHQLKLEENTTALYGRMDGSVRRAIRKSESAALAVDFSSDLGSMRQFYRLLQRTRQRHGVPPQPWSFFKSLHRHVIAQGKGWLALAKCGNVPVAGALFLHSGDTLNYKYGASDDTYQPLRANNLVMWRAIERASQAGFKFLDFGRTSLRNEGLRRFKLGWGSTETQIDYYKYDLRAHVFTTTRDEASGWYNRVFRSLPRPLSQLIGQILYRHIA